MKFSDYPFVFKCLDRHEIEECAEMTAHVFASSDPFLSRLGIKEKDLIQIISKELETAVNDRLTLTARDQTGRICGSYAGFPFAGMKIFSESGFRQINTLRYNPDKTDLTADRKPEIADAINYCLLKEFYDRHLAHNELKSCLFCDWFCVSQEYFTTSLAPDLARSFFLNASSRGMEHIYGASFTARAAKLLMHRFGAKIVKEISIVFENEKEEYKALLLYGNSNDIRFKNI